MDLLHLQQVSVVAHTTHNRLSPDLTRPDLSPDLTSLPTTYIAQPNQPPPHTRLHVTQPPSHTTSYSHPYSDIPSIYTPIIYAPTSTQTHTRLHVQL